VRAQRYFTTEAQRTQSSEWIRIGLRSLVRALNGKRRRKFGLPIVPKNKNEPLSAQKTAERLYRAEGPVKRVIPHITNPDFLSGEGTKIFHHRSTENTKFGMD